MRTAQRRTRKRCRILSLSPMAMRKADELAKAGAMLDEGFMAEGESKDSAAGARIGTCSLAVCSQFSLIGGSMEGL